MYIITRLMNRIREVVGRVELKQIGSNEEKISDIIEQNMSGSLEALKATSLFNLMFYDLQNLSHSRVERGFRMKNRK